MLDSGRLGSVQGKPELPGNSERVVYAVERDGYCIQLTRRQAQLISVGALSVGEQMAGVNIWREKARTVSIHTQTRQRLSVPLSFTHVEQKFWFL